jgi:hypothetical protein
MTTPTKSSYRKPYTPRATYRCAPALIVAAKADYDAAIAELGIPFGTCFCKCLKVMGIPASNIPSRGYFVGVPHRYAAGHRRRKNPVRMIVEDRGYKTPCHIWQWAHHKAGYGVMRDNGRVRPAHCIEYEKVHGPIPKKMYIDHLCRVPACINPDHLEMVTNAENVRRGLRASVTREDVFRLFELRKMGMKWKAIASELGMTYDNARAIACGLRWGDVREEALRVQDLVG